MAGLSDLDVITTLEGYGFTKRVQTPWRGEEPDRWDAYPVEIGNLPDFGRDDVRASDVGGINDSQRVWDSLGDRIFSQSRSPERLPPPGPIDALAWYLPFHYYGPDWGIYIKEAEVLNIAAFIKMRLGGGTSDWRETQQLCRVALSALYLHEAFHHKIESFATRLEISRLSPVYLRYDELVFRPLLSTDDVLEEAIACFEMHSRLRNEKSFHGNVRAAVKSAALDFLHEWILALPPGYRRGTDPHLPGQLGALMSQVAHGSQSLKQNPDDWGIANQMIRGLFNKNLVAHVVVPVGTTPVIPWLDAARFVSISTRELERHITRDFGYSFERQTAAHKYYYCPNRPRIMIPEGRKSLAPRELKQAAEALGYKNIRELKTKC